MAVSLTGELVLMQKNRRWPRCILVSMIVYASCLARLMCPLASGQGVPPQLGEIRLPADLDRPDEIAHNYLYRCGERLRLFATPRVTVSNRQVMKAQHEVTTDDVPAWYLNDDSDCESDWLLATLRPFAVKPFTEYRLMFKQKTRFVRGEGRPYFSLDFMDANFDAFHQVEFPLEPAAKTDNKKSDDGWIPQSHVFKTPAHTHNIWAYLRSSRPGTAELWLDEIYLEQISSAGELMPTRQVVVERVMSVCNPSKTSQSSGSSTLYKAYPLPDARSYCRLSIETQWQGRKGGCEARFTWFDQDDVLLGSHRCVVRSANGVLTQWDAVRADWIADFGRAADPISVRATEYISGLDGGGKTEFHCRVRIPDGARAVRLSAPNEGFAKSEKIQGDIGDLRITAIAVVAEF